jgi:L-threonylcarbamoyladenylate synthase
MNQNQIKAKDTLSGGGIVIFPTDTAYGIGCRMDFPDSVSKLFKIRRRPPVQAVPVLVDSVNMAEKYYSDITPVMEKLMQKYWPGALTIVASCLKEKIPALVRGGGETVGLRIPDYPELLEIISALNIPVLGPSANFHGLPTPFSLRDLDQDLVRQVDFVLPGDCHDHQVSTVVKCDGNSYQIIRQGAVKIEL